MIQTYLFKTNAFKVSKSEPFWYASNTFGPFFINTHYLFGSKKEAEDFLNIINDNLKNKKSAPVLFNRITTKQYESNEIYKNVIDALIKGIKRSVNINEIDYISGGERRDWFFSYIIAKLLNKPHITIFKDLSSNILFNESVSDTPNLKGKTIIHVCDLVTKASSYVNTWIPALKNKGGVLKDTFTVIDRCQGGSDVLNENGINLHSLINIDKDLFDQALEQSIINKFQYDMILSFTKDPEQFMKDFTNENPDFIHKSILKGGKDAKRAAAFKENF